MKKTLYLLTMLFLCNSVFAQGYRVNRTNEKKVNVRKMEMGKNILSFVPMQVITTSLMNAEPDVAIGISYERIFENQKMSFKLPMSASLENGYFYMMPTVKFYPRKQGIVKYAIGPQIFFGTGNVSYYQTYDKFGNYNPRNINGMKTQFGFAVNNSINFTLMKSIYVGIDGSLGLKYFDSMPETNNYFWNNGTNTSVSRTFEMNVSFGYRF